MIKSILKRFANGFAYSIAITLCFQTIATVCSGSSPMVPDFVERFDSEVLAYAVQLLLIGVMSGITSAATIIFDIRKMGLIIQKIIYLLVILGAWIPVACFVWSFNRYIISAISTIASIVVTYAIVLIVEYRINKNEIAEINEKLSKERN